jgi:GTPase SAR1 family protein
MTSLFQSMKTAVSGFMQGKNVIKSMGNYFRTFRNIMEIVFTKEETEKYKLPVVIVIGSESSGKSSLLENITKWTVFPRDAKACTMCPIRVILKNGPNEKRCDVVFRDKHESICKSKVSMYISDIFKEIKDITEDEIIITSVGDYPDMEFIDLPGICEYPEARRNASINLSTKYIQERNNIILCVVPATTPRITNQHSIRLILENNKQKNSILALTMVDRLTTDNLQELLLDRIHNQATEEFKDIEFSNIIGVINRSHKDVVKVEDQDNIEEKWVSENIIKLIPSTHKMYLDVAKEKIGIVCLLNSLNSLYKQFCEETWKPDTLKKLNEELTKLEKQKIDIGYEFTEEEFKTLVISKLDEDLRKYISKMILSFPTFKTELDKVLPDAYTICNVFDDFNKGPYIIFSQSIFNLFYYLIKHITCKIQVKDKLTKFERYENFFHIHCKYLYEQFKVYYGKYSEEYYKIVKSRILTCYSKDYDFESVKSEASNMYSFYTALFIERFIEVYNLKSPWNSDFLKESDEITALRHSIFAKQTRIKSQIKEIQTI